MRITNVRTVVVTDVIHVILIGIPGPQEAPVLEANNLEVVYDDVMLVLRGVSLRVPKGQVVALLGANGAGKTTLMRAFSGLLDVHDGKVTKGSITLDGEPIHKLSPAKIADRGIKQALEGRRILAELTVEENLKVGSHGRRPGPWNLATVYDAFPLLAEKRERRGAHLSGGEQQATAIGRALMSNPKLLLLDEVSLGLAPVVIADIYKALPAIAAKGTTVLVVEQDLTQALAVADRVQCLLEGRTVLEGAAADVTREQVQAAYFGVDAADGKEVG